MTDSGTPAGVQHLRAEKVRYRVCGCKADQPCDEERHRRNREKALDAQCWALHEQSVATDG